LDPVSPSSRIEIPDLFRFVAEPDKIPWAPFHEGVEIYRLYGDGLSGPSAALIRFHPGGRVPLHEHVGHEHIFVLSGSQRDNLAAAKAGSLIVNPPGGRHSIVSEAGCIVLAIYEKPVRFLEEASRAAAVSA
jgi:anti-sigma factor ChrR (cupin superfamily)